MRPNDAIMRAVIASSAELGVLGSALLLLRMARTFGPDCPLWKIGRQFPLYDALIRQGANPERIARRLSDLVDEVDEYVSMEIRRIVCTALEADFVDQLADRFPDRDVVVVRHDPSADGHRVTANYGDNFYLIEQHEIDLVTDPLTTLLVVPVFDAGSGPLFTSYPNTCRVVGEDSASKFAEVLAIDLLGSPFHFFPWDMTQIPVTNFTSVVHLPVVAEGTRRILEGVA